MPKINTNLAENTVPSVPDMFTQNLPEIGDFGREEFHKLKQARERLNDLIQSPDNVSQIEIDKAQNEVRVWKRRLEKVRNG